jgi:dihydropyrimidinase
MELRTASSSRPNHAKAYGLSPRKGTIAIGSDADIAIWDPTREVTISQELMHHDCDYTPYEGLRVTARACHRVRPPVRARSSYPASPARKGAGQYLARGLSPLAKACGRKRGGRRTHALISATRPA